MIDLDLQQRRRHAGHTLLAAVCITGVKGFKFAKAVSHSVNYPTVYEISGVKGRFIGKEAVFGRLHELGVKKQRQTVFRSVRLGKEIDGYRVTAVGRYDRQRGRMTLKAA